MSSSSIHTNAYTCHFSKTKKRCPSCTNRFCSIHSNPSKRPTSEVRRSQRHALCSGSSWSHHFAFWRSPEEVWETDTKSIRSILDRILIVNFSVVTSSYPYSLRNIMQRIYHLWDHCPFKKTSIIVAIVLGTMGHHQYTWCHPKLILALSSREVAVNQCQA